VKLLNFFLSALKEVDQASLLASMTEINLAPGEVLFETGEPIDWVYFPGSACVSFVTLMSDGRAVETSTVGRESVVGLVDAMTNMPSRGRVFAQIGGGAMRISAATFRTQVLGSHSLLRLSLQHVRATALQAEQGVACNATHDVRGRLARWLLMTQDRVGTSSFPLTQEYMAVMTGVQRSTVSAMAGTLKKSGVIDYSRGNLVIRDRPALMKHACECYEVVGQQFEELRDVAE
jgi:CRP-like cAMP-binding protein